MNGKARSLTVLNVLTRLKDKLSMELHLLIKIIHMSSVAALILILLVRGLTLFVGCENDQPNPKKRTLFVALQHLSLTLVAVTGISLLVMNKFIVQPWFYGKILLFLVLISSLIKTYRQDDKITLIQRRAGFFISCTVLITIIGFILIKPGFS